MEPTGRMKLTKLPIKRIPALINLSLQGREYIRDSTEKHSGRLCSIRIKMEPSIKKYQMIEYKEKT